MKLLPQNEAILLKRFPLTFKQISACTECPRIEIDLGKRIFSVDFGNGQKIYPYGIENGKNVIDRWVESIDLRHFSINATTGFGLGLHIEKLLKKMDSESILFVADRSPEILAAIFSTLDCTPILSDPRFVLATGNIDDEFYKSFYDLAVAYKKHIGTFVFSPLQAIDEDYYNRFFMEFAKQFRRHYQLQKTNIEDSPYWQSLTMVNLPYLLQSPDVMSMRNQFEGLPIVLVSAGPSLDESIDFLKKIQDRAVLVVVNSAYRKVANAGIKPHFSIAADPRISTYRGYEKSSVDDVYLLSTFFVNPHVIQLFENRTFTWANKIELVNLIRQRQGEPPPTPVMEQGTVSACIADLAKIWGSKKICLVGQDLAFTTSGQTHTTDSFYTDEGNLFGDLGNCMKVPGNTIEKVPTDPPLFAYLKAFEEIARVNPDIEFINTARLGAKIDGIPYKTYEEAETWFQNRFSQNIRETIAAHFKKEIVPQGNIELLREYLKPTYSFAKKLFRLGLEGALFLENIPGKYANRNYEKHADIQKAMDFGNKINNLIDKNKRDWVILCEGKMKAALFQYKENVALLSFESHHWEAVQKNIEYFWAVVEGAHFLLSELEGLFSGKFIQEDTQPSLREKTFALEYKA